MNITSKSMSVIFWVLSVLTVLITTARWHLFPFKISNTYNYVLNGVLGTFCAEVKHPASETAGIVFEIKCLLHVTHAILTLLCLSVFPLCSICPLHCRVKPHPLLHRKPQGSRRPLTRGLSSENGSVSERNSGTSPDAGLGWFRIERPDSVRKLRVRSNSLIIFTLKELACLGTWSFFSTSKYQL